MSKVTGEREDEINSLKNNEFFVVLVSFGTILFIRKIIQREEMFVSVDRK